MSRPKVYVIASLAMGMPTTLRCVRRDYPDAEVVGVYPRGYQVTEVESKHTDAELFSSARTMSAVGGLLGLIRLAGIIRAAGAEEVVLQFESLKLRLFGIACRPRRLRAWLGNGHRLELPLGMWANVSDLYLHRARGYGVVARAWWHAYVLGMKNEPPERPHGK